MENFLLLLVVVGAGLLYNKTQKLIQALTDRLAERERVHDSLLITVERLRQEVRQLSEAATPPSITTPAPATQVATPVVTSAATATTSVSVTAPANAPAPRPTTATPVVLPTVPVANPVVPVVAPVVAAASSLPPVPVAPTQATTPVVPVVPATVPPLLVTPTTTPPAVTGPALTPVLPTAVTPVLPPVPVAPASAPSPPTPAPVRPQPTAPKPAPARPQPVAVPAEPTGPTWWDRVEKVLLDNWTGILGAVVLVTGIGFLGVYTALRVSAPLRFGMITAFAAALLGLHYYLRPKPFAAKLNVWLQSSAAAIFLFACVGAVSVPGLQWAGPPLSYLLLLAGISLNLWLAWDAGREDVATLHGVLSLVALAVLPRELLTLAAAAGVTVFGIAITYRQRWKYQLLLTILSFFIFHQYWHYAREAAGVLATGSRLAAMALVLLVGAAGAVVQYRRVYAQQRFDALLFSAHVLNWTCLGINLYQYSTGSPWKTVPLALGALLTFGVARQARRLGIAWLFRTDSLISLMLALFAAFSLQGWHASGTLILLFMLLETLLVAFVMAREGERLVFQVASIGAVAAGLGLVILNLLYLNSYSATEISRNALVLLLAGLLGAGYYHLLRQQSLLKDEEAGRGREATQVFGGVVGLLYLGAGVLLARAIFGFAHPPLLGLLGGTLAAAGAIFGGAWYLRSTGGWFRTLHLLSGQALLIVFILGLHETGLGWPATFALLYFETLLLAGACGMVAEKVAYRVLVGLTLASGAALLVAAVGSVRELAVPVLHQRLALMLLTGLGSAGLLLLPPRWPALRALLQNSDNQLLFQALRGITVLFYLSGIGLLLQALFGLPHPPVVALLGAATVAAGLTFALVYRASTQADWFRLGLIVLGQALLTVFILGLHELGLSWPAAVTLLYFETLLLAGAFGLAAQPRAYRLLLGLALGSGVALLFVTSSLIHGLSAPLLHQRLALLLLAALGSAALLLLPARRPVPSLQPINPPDQLLFRALRGLTVLFYLSAIGLLLQALFGRPYPPVAALLGAASGAAGLTFGLAYWVRHQPGRFRLGLVLLGQVLLSVAILGLHKAGLSWPAANTLLYLEMLAFTLLLAWRAETLLYRIMLTASLIMAVLLLPLVYTSGNLPDYQRAALLLVAALSSVAAQAMLHWRAAPVFDAVPLSADPLQRLRLLGLLAGGLLLAAGGLVYEHTWAGWVMAGLGGVLLLLRRRIPVPGLWLGLLLMTLGYQLLQWEHMLPVGAVFRPLPVLLYLLPLLLLSGLGLWGSWWAAAERHVRWPWLYLLGLQAVMASWIAFAPRTEALPVLLWTLLAAGAAWAAQQARQRWTTPAALVRAGWPDRHLLHLTYALLALALVGHFGGVFGHSAGMLLGVPARRLTAGALLLLLTGLAAQRPPATEPTYNSWRYIQPLLPELALLFGCFTFGYELRTEWLALVWLALAFGLTRAAPRLPQRLRRVRAYGLLFFWAAVASSIYVSFNYLAPGQLLTVPWATTAAAVALLFGYAAVRLHQPTTEPADWPPLLAPLTGLDRLPLSGLVGLLLYPAFLALTALLTQSFDRSVLTVLLMLEVVAVFVASLLLRRQDFRYAALIGMAAAVARLLFFDLRQTGTITRAVVFILMGLLLLGMNALYARFKDRFAPEADPAAPPEPIAPSASSEADPLPETGEEELDSNA